MKIEVLTECTPRVVALADLTNKDHVGFIDGGNKRGYIAKIASNSYLSICAEAGFQCMNICYGSKLRINSTVQEALDIHLNSVCSIKKIFVFDTRKELYQWLAE